MQGLAQMFRLSFAVFAVAMLIAAVAQARPATATATVKGAPEYHLRPGAQPTPGLTAAIAKADAELFAAVFDRCDVDAVAAMMTDDFRFVHDKDGYSSCAKFLEDERGHCPRLKTGEDFPARRELAPGSLEVWPIDKYGALEIGTHRFYAPQRQARDRNRNRQLHDPVEAGRREMADGREHLVRA